MIRLAMIATVLLASATGLLAQGPEGEPVDLTYSFDEGTIYWPTAQRFELTVEAEGVTDGGFWYAANSFHAAEHGGTHLDAPIHFAEGRRRTAEIPLDDLMGPAIVVDVSSHAAENADYLIDVAALIAWEEDNGRIPDRTIVLLRTGWGSYWPDPASYLGTAERGPEAVRDLHFPGLDAEAAMWLVSERSVQAVGIDTASIDYGQSSDFRAHQVLASANVPVFENVAHLERVPTTGAWLIGLPMKIGLGTGAPLRLIAFIP